MIQRGDPYQLVWEFQGKKNINFQKIKFILNSIFYIEIKEFTFVEISRIKLLSEPSVRGVVDTKGGPLGTCLRIPRKKKNNNLKKIKLIFNCIFYLELKKYSFVEILG